MMPYKGGRETFPLFLEHFQVEALYVSILTACRFAEKMLFFRSLPAGRRCAAVSRFTLRFTFFKGERLEKPGLAACGSPRAFYS